MPGQAPHVSVRVPHAPAPGNRRPPTDRLILGVRAVRVVIDTQSLTAVQLDEVSSKRTPYVAGDGLIYRVAFTYVYSGGGYKFIVVQRTMHETLSPREQAGVPFSFRLAILVS